MIDLVPSIATVGELYIRRDNPPVREVANAFITPQLDFADLDKTWGVYDANGRLIEEAAYKRGPGRHLIGQAETIELPTDCAEIEEPLIYGGAVQHHFGHFLLSFLPRYWAMRSLPRGRIVVHCEKEKVSGWFDQPFARDTLSAIGLRETDFIAVERALRVGRLVVPAPSFVELSVGYVPFGALCQEIGEVLAGSNSVQTSSDLVYLSKKELKNGVWHIVNEQEIVDHLARRGVRIVCPEQISFSEQIAIFKSHHIVMGPMGSALHTSLFGDGGNRIIGLAYNEEVPSNYPIIDALKRNASSYWHPRGCMHHAGPTAHFQSTWIAPNPKQIADRLIEQATAGAARSIRRNHKLATEPKESMMQSSLDAIGVSAGTDKSSIMHDYLHFYEAETSYLRNEKFFLFEIGVYEGASLRTWGEYFPDATIVGLDIDASRKGLDVLPNTHIRIGDASRLEVLDAIVEEFGKPTIVVDDGSHLWHHQIESLRYLWPRVKPGGMFIMEDIHTSFPTLAAAYKGCSTESAYSYLMELNRWVVGNRFMGSETPQDGFISTYWSTVDSIHWFRGTCIVHKKL